MATLIDEAARVQRETRRLRVELRSLREANRRELDRSRRQFASVEIGLFWAAELRARPLCSPWSSLEWSLPRPDLLDDVLVIVDPAA